MKCLNCNAEIDNDAIFCPECGMKVPSVQDLHSVQSQPFVQGQQPVPDQFSAGIPPFSSGICPRCRNPLPPGAFICPQCGYSLGDGGKCSNQDMKNRKTAMILAGVLAGAVCIGTVVWGVSKFKGTDKNRSQDTDSGYGYETQNYSDDTENYDFSDRKQEEKDASFYEGAADAVHNDVLYFTGTIEPDGSGYKLYLGEDMVNLCAYTDKGEEQRLDDIDTFFLVADSDTVNLRENEKAMAELSGNVVIRNGQPVLFVQDMTVLKSARDEEEIHQYYIIQEDCTWTEAFDKCRDMGGYLVRINTLEEWNHIAALIKSEGKEKLQLYIGARRDKNSDSYYWVDENNEFMGDRLDNGYTDWCSSIWLEGEPSYRETTLDLDELCIAIFRYSKTNQWVMNDVPTDLIGALKSNEGRIGYICEVE